MEGTATTVYAQGGRGNARLIAWEGERTVTFTMEDALISPEGFMILSGAGLIEATEQKPIYQHVTERVDGADVAMSDDGVVSIPLTSKPYLPADKGENFAYVMFVRDGEIVTEPYIPVHGEIEENADGKFIIEVKSHSCYDDAHNGEEVDYVVGQIDEVKYDSVLVDFYVAREAAAKQVEITPERFGGNFYLEASILRLLHYSVLKMVLICLQSLLFLTARFNPTSHSQWHLLVILLASPSQWMLSLITLVLTIARKFSLLFRSLKRLVLRIFTVVLLLMVNIKSMVLPVLILTKIYSAPALKLTANFNSFRERDLISFPFSFQAV